MLIANALKNELLPKFCDHKDRMSKRKKSSSSWKTILQESSKLELGSGWLSANY